MTSIMKLLRRRKDVAAVLSILKIRAEAPKEDKQNIVMDVDNGKTWIGAFIWGAVTFWQDNPIYVIICAAAIIALIIQSIV